MAYIGAEPLPGQNREVDDISSGFNGNATAFTLQVSSVNVSPESANNILINLGGVLQNPGTDYTIAASTITFTTAPAAGLSFFGLILGAGINTATVADQTIGTSKVLDNAITADKLAHTSVTAGSYTTADITVDAQGRITAAASGSISNAEIANNAVTTAKIADSTGASDGVTTAKLATDAVTAAKLASNAVVNASVDASAAIAGSKISPDFGSQNIVTTGGLTVDTTTLKVDNSNNRVGIGTASPSTLLHCNLAAENGEIARFGISGQTNNQVFIIKNDDSDSLFTFRLGSSNSTYPDLRFNMGADVEAMRIDSSGRLLIGFSSDLSGNDTSAKLQVTHTGGGTVRLVRDDLTVTSNENLGRLIFSGRDGGANVNCAELRATATQTHDTNSRGTRFTIHLCKDNESTPFEALRLDQGGKLGIGGNAARMFGVSVPSTQGNIGAAEFANNKSDNTAAVMFMSTLRDGSSTESFLQCNKDQNNDGTGVAATVFIRTNGDFDSATNSYGGISDIKLKENIVDANSQWDDIKNLRIRNFNFKTNPSQKMLGLVAQEVETVCPYLVKEAKDENLTSSNSGDEGTTTKSVKYSILYMKAIKALQEAIAKIETLETKVAALEAA